MQDFDKKIERAGIDFFDRISFLRNLHDKFADHYNQNKIGAFADLIKIRSELVHRSTIKLDQDERRLNKLKSLFRQVKEKIEKHKKGTLNDEIKFNLDQWNEFFIAGNQLFDLKSELMEMTKLDSDRDHKNDLLRYVKLSNKFHGGICNFLGEEYNKNDAYNGYKLIEDIKKLHLNLSALDTICKIIIDQGYPTNIFTWKELSKAKQEEIIKKTENRAGRKNKKSVPQKEIKIIVSNLIKDRNSKRYIHQNGKWEGNANVNQIYQYIAENHKELEENLSMRRMKTRIKRALPNDMK